MTKEEKEIMLDLYSKGVPKTTIAKKLGYCTATISRNLKLIQTNEPLDTMIGQRFGLLTVINQAEKRQDLVSRSKRYLCKCDCGKIIEVDGNALRTGHTRSCGCIRSKSAHYTDLTNQRFGKLIALYLEENSNADRRKMWHCICDCGNECTVDSKSLLDGTTKSCGCVHSFKEAEIINILQSLKINYIKEYTFTDLRGKSHPLRFDFGILDKNNNLLFLIEYQGSQHYDKNNTWHTKELEQSDNKKKKYCQEKNIPLYELNINDNLEERIKNLIVQYGYKL